MEILKTPEMFPMEHMIVVVSLLIFLLWRSSLPCPFMMILQAPEMLSVEEMFIVISTFSSLVRRSPAPCSLKVKASGMFIGYLFQRSPTS